MALPPPARLGDPVDAIDTPALLLDLDAFERNVTRMAATVAGSGVALRPNAKSHKCPEIALRQIEAGAVGICAQKVSEAEAMVAGGVEDVLVSNEIVGQKKMERLTLLARSARIGVCVDDLQNIDDLDQAARAAGVVLDVLVEINVGARCGVQPGDPAAALAGAVASKDCLSFRGLQAYQGPAQHRRTVEERRMATQATLEHVERTLDALHRAGLDCPTITGAGTGTFLFEMESGVYTELQPGSYVFMDADYNRNDWTGFPPFEQSLFVLASVMSRPSREHAILDAGLKALSVDSGLPEVARWPGVAYAKAADEHGRLDVPPTAAGPRLGEKVMLVPGHCDPTVNLHDWIVGCRAGVVEAIWPISARGAGF